MIDWLSTLMKGHEIAHVAKPVFAKPLLHEADIVSLLFIL
jgi:hypothetical protein